MTRFYFIAFVLVLLAGCGTAPATPEIVIKSAQDESMFSEKDAFVVKKPIAQVSDILKKKSAECLKKEISSTGPVGGGSGPQLYQTTVVDLTPKVVVGKQHTRLTIQYKIISGPTELGDPPPDGWYFMVVEAYPVDKNTTRVESYYRHTSYHGAFTAVKPWVMGTSSGCPDLTK